MNILKKMYHKPQALVLFAIAAALIWLASCTYRVDLKPDQINPSPSATLSPTILPEYPLAGWHEDYNKWLAEGYEQIKGYNQFICPKSPMYENMWIDYWRAIVKAESGMNRLSRYQEVGIGVDYYTKKETVSEGLFQLSYADERGYPACDFDWDKDKAKDPKDPSRTIFDAKAQFTCAMGIAKKLFEKYPGGHPKWGNPLSSYWSVTRPGKSADLFLRKNYPQCFK